MSKKIRQKIDYSKFTLPELIANITKRKSSFLELEYDEKLRVLECIETHNLAIKAFGQKWYDVLSGKFYAIEYFPKDESSFELEKETKEFSTFGDFFEYVDGDIYEDACFYGYSFSKDEIADFKIDRGSLNFDSFTDECIDQYTFESIGQSKEESLNEKAERRKAIAEWFRKPKPIKTLDDLEKEYGRFSRKFDFWDSDKIFFSILLRTSKNLVKEATIEFACVNAVYKTWLFDEILLTYGREAALRVIDDFKGDCGHTTKARRIRSFKDVLTVYDSETFGSKREFGFDDSLGLFYVNDRRYNDENCQLDVCEYFTGFNEFASFVDHDLTGADLSGAPISEDDLKGCKISDATKLPLSKQYATYETKKRYADGKFVVIQRWLDSKGDVILRKKHAFDIFFDFVHFLKGDLSGTNLLMCDGIENLARLKGLKLDGLRVRSEAAKKLGLPLNEIPKDAFEAKGFELSSRREIETAESLLAERPEDDDYPGRVNYISDIHLLHRFEAYKCKTFEDVEYVIRTIAKTLAEQSTGVNLIAGDTSSDFGVFKSLLAALVSHQPRGDFFFTLGNHELWSLNGENLESIVTKYKAALNEEGNGKMHLVQNNIFYANKEWIEINEEDLSRISSEDLRAKTRGSSIVIFGGIGFAGTNSEFNADNGIYMNVVDRKREIQESAKFLALYEKVTTALKGRNLIVLTHMPMRDWGGPDIRAKNGVVYVNGHNHRNYFFDDGRKRIYADNQVGYKGKKLSFKKIAFDFSFDWFADYEDGIYEITKEDYEEFYRGIWESLTFKRQFEKLFMVKREGTYMFFLKTSKGRLQILNGGAIKGAGDHSLEYFYAHLAEYSKSISLFLSKYDRFQKEISSEIKKIGGDGYIHGSIVDIDFYNHLYLNPLDGTITPYMAYSMIEKYVYDNVPSLLKAECPKLFANYERMIGMGNAKHELAAIGGNLPIVKGAIYVDDTGMYRVSRILKGLQYTTKYNVVRLWNDAIVADASEANGKLIVSGIIDPDSMPKPIPEPKQKAIRESKPKPIKPVLSEEEKIKIRDDKYKALVSKETEGRVLVETYRGSIEKADYRCALCGYAWSTRPDHFKTMQKSQCPKCSKNK